MPYYLSYPGGSHGKFTPIHSNRTYGIPAISTRFDDVDYRLPGSDHIYIISAKPRLSSRKTDKQISTLISNLVRWSIIIMGTITALEINDFEVTAFVAGIGVAGITIGFALQDTLSNFVAGMLLLIQKPFKTGDQVEIGGFFGQGEEVDLRATRLCTPDGKDVLVPNKDVLGGPITN